MNVLTIARFHELCISSKEILMNCGAGAPSPGSKIMRDYGMYRLGDDDFLNVGFAWWEGDVFRAAKVQHGRVTDHYIIMTDGGPYYSIQINPETMETIAKYKRLGNGAEPKLDPETNEVLQENFYTSHFPLPRHYVNALRKVDFPFIEDIYCWAEKPYGSCVEFSCYLL